MSVQNKLKKIDKILGIGNVLKLDIDGEYVKKYYYVNKIPYSLFHATSDLIHMGISRDGIYKDDDLLASVRIVENEIGGETRNVLELATGRGGNSFYLAKRFPDTKFIGIDISPGQLGFARKKARKVANYLPIYGDYHELGEFRNNMFDMVFIVEALCYSESKEKVLSEINRVLRPNGKLIIIDGYYEKKDISREYKIAQKLVAKGMAMNDIESYERFLRMAKRHQFNVAHEENVSNFVLPTIKRFEKTAEKFFRYDLLARLVSKILPKKFTYNAISGYLMPELFENNAASYWITILKKS